MASGSAVQVEIMASFGQYQAGLVQASQAMAQMVAQMKGSLGQLDPAFKSSAEHSDGLFGSMKQLKTEAVTHGRVFGFYGQQLAGLTGITKGLGTELAGLGIAMASGMWVVAIIEGVKLIAGAFRESNAAADEFNKKKLDDIKTELKGVEQAAAAANDALWGKMGGDVASAATERKIQLAAWNLDQLHRKVDAYNTNVREEDRAAYKEALQQYRELIALADLEREARSRSRAIDTSKEEKKDATKAAKEEAAALAKIGKESNEAAWRFEEEAAAKRYALEKEEEKHTKDQHDAAWKMEEEAAAKRYALEKHMADQSQQLMLKQSKQWLDVGVSMSEAVGATFGAVATGQMTALEGMKSIMAQMVQLISRLYIEFEIEAALAAVKAGGSAAMTPFIGPILGVAAASSMFAAMMAYKPSGREFGGMVNFNTPYMVGESGPELFVPNTSGKIVPNHQLGSGGTTNVTIHVRAYDTKDVRRFFLDNDAALAEGISQALRKGRM